MENISSILSASHFKKGQGLGESLNKVKTLWFVRTDGRRQEISNSSRLQ